MIKSKFKQQLCKVLLTVLLGSISCGALAEGNSAFRPALEVFLSKYLNLVAGKRVGLLTNPTGVDRSLRSTADVFRTDSRINLTALFAPEHGIRGDLDAGQAVKGGTDHGIPIFALYGGKDHRPTREQLSKIDVLVYHIQDVGCRSYTYIWQLAEAMSACAQAKIPVIVLDVPNPVGVNKMDGMLLEPRYKSFIGLYSVPYIYGMTAGELAWYLNRVEKINCQLYVIPMHGYRRNMSFEDTRQFWVPTSPNIPSPQSAYCYAVTGPIGTLGRFNIGIGGQLPFQVVAAPRLDGEKMSRTLNDLHLPGIQFRPISLVPKLNPYKDQRISGVQVHVKDPVKLKPVEAMIQIMCYLRDNYGGFGWEGQLGATAQNGTGGIPGEGFDKAMGTGLLREQIERGSSAQLIINNYQKQLELFAERAKPFYIYR